MNTKRDATADFGEFVKRQQDTSEEAAEVDWSRERDEWLATLQELYGRTESFLAEYIRAGEIKIDYRDIPLNEENIGSYIARQMTLKIGRQQVTMTPVGTLLIGMKGRVDVVGPAGRARLVLVDSEASGPRAIKVAVSIGGKPDRHVTEAASKTINWEWKIATSPPSIHYIELTQESLFQVLLEVANG